MKSISCVNMNLTNHGTRGTQVCVLTLTAMVPFTGSQCCLKSSFSLSLDTVAFLRLNRQTEIFVSLDRCPARTQADTDAQKTTALTHLIRLALMVNGSLCVSLLTVYLKTDGLRGFFLLTQTQCQNDEWKCPETLGTQWGNSPDRHVQLYKQVDHIRLY